jgi:hypothetical protein
MMPIKKLFFQTCNNFFQLGTRRKVPFYNIAFSYSFRRYAGLDEACTISRSCDKPDYCQNRRVCVQAT